MVDEFNKQMRSLQSPSNGTDSSQLPNFNVNATLPLIHSQMESTDIDASLPLLFDRQEEEQKGDDLQTTQQFGRYLSLGNLGSKAKPVMT